MYVAHACFMSVVVTVGGSDSESILNGTINAN